MNRNGRRQRVTICDTNNPLTSLGEDKGLRCPGPFDSSFSMRGSLEYSSLALPGMMAVVSEFFSFLLLLISFFLPFTFSLSLSFFQEVMHELCYVAEDMRFEKRQSIRIQSLTGYSIVLASSSVWISRLQSNKGCLGSCDDPEMQMPIKEGV